MQVYIQQTTSNYLYSHRGWVQSVLEADTFPSTIEALNLCSKQHLSNVHIRVHSAENPEYDTIFSVDKFPQRSKVPAMH
jgi:hypothetical protein